MTRSLDEDQASARRALGDVVGRAWRDRPASLAPVAAVVFGLVAMGWWLTRPEPPPPIETLLPSAAEVDPGPPPTTSPVPVPGASDAVPDTSGGPVSEPVDVVVHVAGAVVRPGLVTVEAPARVADVVAAAGGLVAGADADRLNLAAPVADGERIFVPVVGQDQIPPVVPGGSGNVAPPADPGASAPPALVELNTADQAGLEALPGVGPATARAILTFIAQNGPFSRVEDLLEVPGIGPAKLEQIRPYVSVG